MSLSPIGQATRIHSRCRAKYGEEGVEPIACWDWQGALVRALPIAEYKHVGKGVGSASRQELFMYRRRHSITYIPLSEQQMNAVERGYSVFAQITRERWLGSHRFIATRLEPIFDMRLLERRRNS